ncbi:hypothetical protein JB92DRAFT_2829124 [Gautieria morchelliformis]|nr:hypothetical protein JB92DRAFT_2829124 [Gautieria morchelliformis]
MAHHEYQGAGPAPHSRLHRSSAHDEDGLADDGEHNAGGGGGVGPSPQSTGGMSAEHREIPHKPKVGDIEAKVRAAIRPHPEAGTSTPNMKKRGHIAVEYGAQSRGEPVVPPELGQAGGILKKAGSFGAIEIHRLSSLSATAAAVVDATWRSLETVT